MSIIERALGKQRGSLAPDHDAAKSVKRQLRTREPLISVGERTHEHRPPRDSIRLDLDALRACGMLPAAEAAERVIEQFRRIKWPVLESAAGGAPGTERLAANVVMIASSIAGEGKTFTSLNLAFSIAREKDFSVLLIDADVAKRHLTQLFGCQDRPGITDAVADSSIPLEDLVLGTGVPGFCFLPAGRHTTVAPELFASERMTDLVRDLGETDPRRIILFDSSPLLATNESQVLCRLVDQVVVVVRAEWTHQAVVLEAIHLLDASKQIRCVLNQSRTSGMTEYYYGYGYYSHDRPQT